MSRSTTTLYIDDAGIRLLVAKGKRITKLASVPLETGLNNIDSPEKERELSEKIRELFKSNKISDKKIILGISGLRCLTRPVTLPELPKTMLGEAIIREAKRVLPVPPEQLYISWQVLAAEAGKILAFMIALPRQSADMLIRIIHDAGLKPYLMDIKPVALARLAREATSILVDVQPKEFDIVIVVGGLPQPIRTVAFPEEELSLSDKAMIANNELEKTLEFYNANNPDFQIPPSTPVLVSGELSEEPEIYQTLGANLGLQVEVLVSPLKCLKHLDPSQHLVNVGLTLKESPKDGGPLLPNFNTLPEPYQPRQIPTNKLMAIPAAVAAIALVALLGITIQDAAGRLQMTKSQMETTNFLLEKKQTEQTELTKAVAELEKQLNNLGTQADSYSEALEVISQHGEDIDADLDAVVDSLVTQLDLGSLNHNGTALAINGSASSEQEVIRYARELFDTGRFSEVTIQSVHRESEASENVTFSLSIRLQEKD